MIAADSKTGKGVSERWHVVRSRQGQEYRAARELRNQHFRVYLPKSYIKAELPRLRFNAYLFVAFDAFITDRDGKPKLHPPAYAAICSTYGVSKLFCDVRDVPMPVHDREIRTIQVREDEEFEEAFSRRTRRSANDGALAAGTNVIIIKGAGYGQKGQVLSHESGMVRFLAGSFIAEVEEDRVQTVGQERGRNSKGHLPQFLTKARA